MRKGWRELLTILATVLLGTVVHAAPPEPFAGPGKAVRIAVEVTWTVRTGASDAAIALGLTEGRIIEALAWPSGERRELGTPPVATLDLGSGRTGRVRALIEAPLAASLRLQGGGQAILIPILALVDGAQRTPPQAPVEIVVERLPWDSVLVDPGAGDGVVAPGATV